MTIRIAIAGATGWVGRALVEAVAAREDLTLVAAIARGAAGQDVGTAIGGEPLGVKVSATLQEALSTPSDVVIDYTKPDIVKAQS